MSSAKTPPKPKRRVTMAGMPEVARRLTVSGMGAVEAGPIIRDSATEIATLRTELARAEATNDGFLGMVHEIRTLVAGLTGLTAMVLDGQLDEEQRHHVQLIRASSGALVDLVNNILDWSRLESGTVEVESADFDVRRKLEEVADLVASRARDKKLHLACAVDPDVPAAVRGDAVRIRQVLLNFASNAIKYTDAGSIVLRARLAAPREGSAPDVVHVRFEVIDSGRGLPEGELERVFEAFHQVDVSEARKVGGTGLGLAISKGLVEAMGGSVGCESRPGEGATFFAEVPLKRRAGGGARPPTGRVDLSDRRALVVEADGLTRAELARVSRDLGIDTVEAATPIEAHGHVARALLEKQPFDLVVTGVHWEEGDAKGALMALTGPPGGAPRPRLVVAAYPDERLTPEARALVAARIPRPVREAQLVATLSGAFSSFEETAGGARARRTPARPEAERPDAPSRPIALLVEDDDVNAKVTAFLLQKRGLEVDRAVDGEDAVEKVNKRPYAVVFMDLHTPRMDGLEATRTIRAREADGARIPIVAMTAMAIDGTREACLGAGMDDYLTKPVVGDALEAVLDKWVRSQGRSVTPPPRPRVSESQPARPAASAPPAAPAEVAPEDAPRVDVEALRSLTQQTGGGRSSMVTELIKMFGEAVPRRLGELEEGARSGEARKVERAAHSLKGMALQIGAVRLGRMAGALELAARAGEVRDAVDRVGALGREAKIAVRLVEQELEALVRDA